LCTTGKKPPKWAEMLPWNVPAVANAELVKTFVYQLDTTSRMPWRATSRGRKDIANKEYGVWAKDQPTGEGAPAIAEWVDGDRREMPDITAAELASWGASGSGAKSTGEAFWAGEHTVTKHHLSVKRRQDRRLLAALFEQKKQICSVQVLIFAKPGQEPEGPEAELAALTFMKELAGEFAADIVKHEELFAHRDQRMAAMNMPLQKRGGTRALKKPAAAAVNRKPAAAVKSEQSEHDEAVEAEEAAEDEEGEEAAEGEEDEEMAEDGLDGESLTPSADVPVEQPAKKRPKRADVPGEQPAKKKPAAAPCIDESRLLAYLPAPPSFGDHIGDQ
jgi:hypothetical protein